MPKLIQTVKASKQSMTLQLSSNVENNIQALDHYIAAIYTNAIN